ncbi:MAG TPA: hypothetical protein VNA14_02370 [Mycobacteriales bacterium]|nr:hypothetical protein [Mycobacteriales bacterium]
MSDEPTVDTGKGRIPLDHLGRAQPGMARLMAELAPRVWYLYYAAHAGNWPLAGYYHATSVSLLRDTVLLRPKYADAVAAFVATELRAVKAAVDAKDLAAFESAYAVMLERTDRYHAEFNKPFIRWRTPAVPPPDLDLTPYDGD